MSGSVSLVNGHIDPDKKRITDKQIIQALNTATNVDGLQICCIDYENNPKNVIYLSIKSDILALINRQQSAIDVYMQENDRLKTAADVVEVVRCKDCTYCSEHYNICHYGVGRDVKPDHYCGYGERR